MNKFNYVTYHALVGTHKGYEWKVFDTYKEAIDSKPHWIIKGKIIYDSMMRDEDK